jgi:hypothetical protein
MNPKRAVARRPFPAKREKKYAVSKETIVADMPIFNYTAYALRMLARPHCP